MKLLALVAELNDITARLVAAADAGCVSAMRGPALAELTAELVMSANQLASVTIHATGHLHVSGELSALGFISTKSWLINTIGLGDREADVALSLATSMHT